MSLDTRIAQNTFLQLGGKIISTILGAIATLLMVRSLGAEQFGWYITASSFLQFTGIISDFGFTLTTTNLISEGVYNKQKILNTTFTLRFFSALLFQILAPLLFILFGHSTSINHAVIITTISFFALALNQVFVGYFQATLKNYLHMIGEVIGRITLVIGITLVIVFKQGFVPMMWAITVASIIYTIFLLLKLPRLRFEYDKHIGAAFLKKTWPVALSIVFNAIYLQGDRVLLPFFVSQREVGLYGAAYKLLDFVIQCAALLMGIMLPLLTASWAKQNFETFKKYFHNSFLLVALILFPAVVGSIVLGNPLMRIIGGADFSESGAILQILSVAIIGICFGMIGGHTLLALNKQRISLYIFGSNACLSLIGYIICIPRFGIWGAAGVTIFSECYAGLALCASAAYYAKQRLPFVRLGKILLASLGMGIVLYYFSYLPLFLSLLLGIGVYSGLVLLLQVIPIPLIREVLSSKKISN